MITYIFEGKKVPPKPVVLLLPDGRYLIKYIGVDKAMTHRELCLYVQNAA